MKLKIFPTPHKMAYNTHMDMKKKLEGAYLPDKEGRKKRLVVGLSGGLNSYVSAYLLKIQKYELIGVTLVTNWESFKSDSASVLSCQLDATQVEAIKTFCHQLGIPHFVVKASDEFKEVVVEPWVAGRISGTKIDPCWNCHDLRMRLLHQKMLELDAQGIATGHLAKLFRQESHHSVYVHTSNDEIFDQSNLLSRLPHEILENLMLPLSDLQQKEIDKLAENFGLTILGKKIKMHECLDNNLLLKDYLTQNVAPRFFKPGEVLDHEKASMGNHDGVVNYEFGKVYNPENGRQPNPLYFSKFSFPEKRMELAHKEHFKRQKIFLNYCKISEETPWSEPFKGGIKLKNNEFVDCWIYPKNIFSALIEMEAPYDFIEGEIVSIYKKKGKNSKVYLTGVARYVQEVAPSNQEEGKESVKVDYSRDF